MSKSGKNRRKDNDKKGVILRTALTPEELAKEIGGTIGYTTGEAAKKHVIFMPRTEFDEAYKARYEVLCELLDDVNAHCKAGNMTREAEYAVARCLSWYIDQFELFHKEQKQLVAWLMEANAEVTKFQQSEQGSRGGSAAAAVAREVRDFAINRARELEPPGGWASAPQAADEIYSSVKEFARTRGRSFSSRIIAEWLREAGIKRASTRSSD